MRRDRPRNGAAAWKVVAVGVTWIYEVPEPVVKAEVIAPPTAEATLAYLLANPRALELVSQLAAIQAPGADSAGPALPVRGEVITTGSEDPIQNQE